MAAPDKFKGTLTAAQAAAHIAAGLQAARPGLTVEQVPVADGGDGTVASAIAAGYQPERLTVRGPTGLPAEAEFAVRDGTAIIEAAQACGLSRLPGGVLRPLTATSFGVGELIAAAAARGAHRIVLGIGGVASTDGGAGMIQALGGRLAGRDGNRLPPGGAALAALDRLDLAGLIPLAGIEVLVASDVNNPLLGSHGAAAVYGPQKGATPADVATLESALARWADYAERALAGHPPGQAGGSGRAGAPGQAGGSGQTGAPGPGQPPRAARLRDEPGSGAAGGLGFAAQAFLGARTRPGIELMLELIGFGERLAGARLVITGEGSLDEQTLHGKAPAGVARAVAAAGAARAAADAAAAGEGSLAAQTLHDTAPAEVTRVVAAADAGPAHAGAVGAVAVGAAAVGRPPVVAVAGQCTLTAAQLRGAGIDAAYAIADIEPDLERCLAEAGPLLEEVSRRLADDWLPDAPAAGQKAAGQQAAGQQAAGQRTGGQS